MKLPSDTKFRHNKSLLDNVSHDGIKSIAGDAACIFAIAYHSHVASFSPSCTPTEERKEKSHT